MTFPASSAMPTTPSGVRDRLLDVACDLFYRQGVRAVGVDTIVACSGVAKTSLYRNFPSKDDLVVAYLEERDRLYWQWWDGEVARHSTPREQIEGLFASIVRRTAKPTYRGCPFVNTATEFPDPAHPAVAVIGRHQAEVRRRFTELARAMGAADPAGLADQLHLVMNGAYSSGQMQGAQGPSAAAAKTAAVLIAGQLPRSA
ncbi:MAG TPA: TetR/AcrR family transcriptional regulator [Stellaceae bacterium]|nr:TetR/AcrR family transcriptional regulator [Stellaceae bacterium]